MSKPILTERDWSEIYYSLESKRTSPTTDGVPSWQAELANIMEKIGPDGQEAAEHGVDPA